MIALGASDSIRASASVDNAIATSIMGLETASGADTPKVMDQRLLTSAVQTLYTPGASKSAVARLGMANTTGSPVNVSVYVNGAAATNLIATVPIPANGEATFDGTGWKVLDGNGAVVTSVVYPVATAAPPNVAAASALGSVTTRGAREDHTHGFDDTSHGNRAGGTLHAGATTSTAGFMPGATMQQLANDSISVANLMTYGGNNAAGADNAAAFTAASNALPATGGVIYLPIGTYLLGSTVTATKTLRIVGDNHANTVIRLTSGTANGFDFTSGWNGSIENVQIDSVYTTVAAGSNGVQIGLTGQIAVAELANFPTAGTGSIATSGGWHTFTWSGKSVSSGPGNLTGISNQTGSATDTLATGGLVINRTAGYAVNMTANYTSLYNVNVYGMFNGVNHAAALGNIDTVEVRNFVNDAVNVTGNNDKFIARLTTATPTLGRTSIRIDQTSSLLLHDCQILNGAVGLDLNPGTSSTIPSVEAVNCFFDNNTIGMRVTTQGGTGSSYRSKFTNCWFSSASTAGVQFATGQYDGFTFVNCDFYGCGIGISATAGGFWSVQGSRIAGNTTGIALTGSATHFPQIVGNHIGPTGAFGANTTGIVLNAGTYKGMVLANNNVTGNTTNATLGAVTLAGGNADASLYRIIDNPGINPRSTSSAPAVPASTVAAVNTTGFRCKVFLKGGTITVISVNGIATGQTVAPALNTVLPLVLEPGASIAVTYSVAPTWVWVTD